MTQRFCKTCKYWDTAHRPGTTGGACRLPHSRTGSSFANPVFDRATALPVVNGQGCRDIHTGPLYSCIHHHEVQVNEILIKMDGKQKVLLFGGSFDPPTKAHVEMPQMVAKEVGADLVIYIPAKRSPHKLDPKGMPATGKARVNMLLLALQDCPDTTVWTYELEQESSASFTIDTLKAFKDRLNRCTNIRKPSKINLLIGSDQAVAFKAWKDYEEIVDIAEPMVSIRPPHTANDILRNFAENEREDWLKRIVKVEEADCSSTEVRDRVGIGESISHLVHPDVEKYIEDNLLYRANSSGDNQD